VPEHKHKALSLTPRLLHPSYKKRNRVQIHPITWTNLKNIILSEKSQSQNVLNKQIHRDRKICCGQTLGNEERRERLFMGTVLFFGMIKCSGIRK
jgi:hypothetical protein